MITCLMVCVNYGDMLSITLPLNKDLFNNVVVVTTPEDEETISVCNKHGIKTLLYNCCFCYYDKQIVADPTKLFHLSKMINQGLMYIREQFLDDWILYLNSDIVLEPKIKFVNTDKLDENILYGSYRHLIPTKEEFLKIYNDGIVNFENAYKMFPDSDKEKSLGLGFFQLFKKSVFYDQQYSTHNNNYDASVSDLLFINKFKGVQRLEDYTVLHLGVPGINWYGRISERW